MIHRDVLVNSIMQGVGSYHSRHIFSEMEKLHLEKSAIDFKRHIKREMSYNAINAFTENNTGIFTEFKNEHFPEEGIEMEVYIFNQEQLKRLIEHALFMGGMNSGQTNHSL